MNWNDIQQKSNESLNEVDNIVEDVEYNSSQKSSVLGSPVDDTRFDQSQENSVYRTTKEQDQLSSIAFQLDINMIIANDKSKFLGSWQNERYHVNRTYLKTKQKNIKLYHTIFTPLNRDIIAAIVIVHGFGEHSGRFLHLADFFASNGFKTFLYDQRGFGFSGGIRGNASVEEMHEDLETVLLNIERSLPVFVFCHALGAALVYSFCLSNPSLNLQGVISTNAYLKLAKKYNFGKIILLKLLNFFIKDININSYINLTHCSKNNYHIKKVAQDPLIYPFLSIKMAYNIYILTNFIGEACHNFKIPVLLIHGKEDKVSHHINSIDFYRLIASKEKTLKIFQQGYHELQHDVECDRLKQMVVSWCNKMCLRDRRIAFIRELNHGIVHHQKKSKKKRILIYLLLIIFLYLFQNRLQTLKKTSKALIFFLGYGLKQILIG